MLFHSIDLGKMDICISRYLIHEKMKFFADANRYTSEFHNVLKGKSHYRLKGFDWRRIKEGEYNLIYLDEVKNEVRFTGPVFTFDIQVDKELIFELADEYPQLRPFASKMRKGEKASLYDEFSANSFKSMLLIVRIYTLLEKGAGKSQEVKDLTLQLVKALITNETNSSKYHYNYMDIQTLIHASEMLIKHMDEKNVLANQLRKSHLSEDKFREGFHLLFDTNPKHFLLAKRMEKAKELHRKGYSLTDICEQTGYDEITSLSEAFYLFYGYHMKNNK